MTWLPFDIHTVDLARNATGVAANWLLQSSLIIAAGLFTGRVLRTRGSAVQSAVYRTTLAAVLAGPLVTAALSQGGVGGWAVEMPSAWMRASTPEPEISPSIERSGIMPALDAVAERYLGAPMAERSPDFYDMPGSQSAFSVSQEPPVDHGGSSEPIAAESGKAIRAPQTTYTAPAFVLASFGTAAIVVSLGWITVSTILFARLAIAWSRLAHIRRGAAPADVQAVSACREIASQLGVTPPEVLRSPFVPSPCLTGVRRPAVLLPADAGELALRDVLAHELAHLRRGDCLWNLACRIASAGLFFQPLVWVLSRRLESTAEEVCDDFVVQLGGDRRSYAHRLVDVAELSLAPFAAAGVGIVSLRSMLGRRVARIMDTSRSLSTRVGGVLLALVLVGGLLGTLAAGLVGLGARATQAEPTVEEPMAEPTADSPGADATAEDSAATEAKQKHIVGRVVSPDGEPVAGATVLAIWVVPLSERPTERHEHMVVAKVASDADGQFELNFSTEPPTERTPTYGWHVVAFKPGLGPAWRRDVHLLKDASPTLQLTRDVPIRGRLLDLEGRPVAGAAVRIRSLQPTQSEADIANWIKESQEKPIPDLMEDVLYNSGDERYAGQFPSTPDDGGLASGSPALPVDARTGADGAFSFAGVGENRLALLEVEGPTLAKTKLAVVTRDMQPLVARALHITPPHNGTFFGREFDFVAGPTQPIVGTVTDAETGQPIAGMEIRVGQFAGNTLGLSDFLATRTNAEGRYRLVGAPAGGGHRIDAAPKVDEPYFPQNVEAPAATAEQEEIVCDMSLRRGRWIEGRVTASDDDAPVEGATVQYLPLRSNKHAVDYPYFDPRITGAGPSDRFKTAADGSFRVLAIPGEGILMGIARWEDRETFCSLGMDGAPKHIVDDRGYPLTYLPWTLTNTHAVREFDVDAEAEESTCDLQFTRGLKRTVKLVDAAGLPAVGVRVLGRVFPPNLEKPLDDSTVTIMGLRPGAERDVVFIHPERRIGKALNLAAGDETTITLEPCAVARGRVVDEDGAPLAGVSVGVTIDHPDNWHRGLLQSATDAEGRFEALLPPGITCRVSHYSASGPNFSALCEATPGAVFELGDLTHDVKLSIEQTAKLMVAAAKESVEETLVNDSPVANHEVSTQPLSYSGRVETPQGEPIAGAKIWLAVTSYKYASESNRENGEGLLRELGTANEQGRFEVVLDAATTDEIRKRLHFSQAQLAATAKGRGLDWLPLDMFEDNPAPSEKRDMLQARIDRALGDGRFASRALKLRPESQPVRGRLVDLEGHRLPNVTVLVESLRQPDIPRLLKAFEMSWKREMNEAFSATSIGVGGLARSELQKLIPPVTTDDNGEFELRGIGDDQLVTLVFEADRVEARPLYVLGREMETVSLPHIEYLGGAKDVFVGRDFIFAVGPSVPVEGVVTDYDTGEPVANVLVYVERLFKEGSVNQEQLRLDTHHMRAVTDGQGRFRINGMPPGEGHVVEFLPPRSEPYFPVSQDVSLSLNDGDPKRIEIQMKRGIWIEGRVTDKQSGERLLATVDYLALRKNPHSLDKLGLDLAWVEKRYGTDSNGRYRVPGLPGPGVLLVTSQVSGYPLAAGAETIDGYDGSGGVILTTPFPLRLQFPDWHLVNQIDPAADAISLTRDLVLDAGISIPGRVAGPDGKPISDLYVLGQTERDEFWRPKYQDNVSTTDRFTVYDYDGKGPRQLFFKNQDESLVGQYRLEGDAPEEIVVTLQSSVRVTGRLIENETDLPAARYFVLCEECTLFNEEHPPVKFRIHWCLADDEGRFEIKGLMAGLAYKMNALNESNFADDRNRFTIDLTAAKPGDVIELGDVTGLDSEGEAFAAAAEDAATPAAAAVVAEVPAASVVRGRVLGPDGQPAAGADVAVTAMRIVPRRGGDFSPNGDVLAEARTGADGSFEMSLVGVSSKTHRYPMLIVRAAGAALGWRKLDLEAPAADAAIELQAESPVALRLVDIEGQPAVGARVSVAAVMQRSPLDGSLGSNGAGFRSERLPAAWFPPMIADAKGRIEVPHLAENFGVSLQVSGDERFAPQDLAVNTGMEEQRGERDGTYRPLVVNNVGGDGTTSVPLAPAQLFTGTVTYEDTGEPAPHARLTIWASQEEYGSMLSVAGEADDEGRYRISPNPGIRFGVTAYPPDGTPYLVRTHEQIAWRGGDKSREVDVKLPRGVLVRGQVLETDSDATVAGASVQYVPESVNNPHAKDDIVTGWQGIQVTDEHGRFQIAVLPGPGRLLVHGPDGEYVLHEVSGRELYRGTPGGERNYANAIERIDPAADSEPLDLTILLDRGQKVRGELVDPTGAPVDQAIMVTRLTVRSFWLSWRGEPVDVVGGNFEAGCLGADQEAPVHFLDPRHKLGATLVARAGMEPQRVVLEPCGKATMRFVDGDGQPVDGYEPNFQFVATPGVHQFSKMARDGGELAADADFLANVDRLNHDGYRKTGADGKFELAALIPGATYRIVGYRGGEWFADKDFVAEGGKTLDLGDIVVELPEL